MAGGCRSKELPDDALAAYVGVYAVRYLSWSVGTDMEEEVLDSARRMLRKSNVTSESP
jgi:hypothetical protein